MKACSLTDIGVKREMNQDYFFVSEEGIGTVPNLFVVADGMGGHKAGEFASRFAVETIVSEVRRADAVTASTLLAEAIEKANSALWLHGAAHMEKRGMGTTAVAAVLRGSLLTVANVGDSRLYVAGSKMRQITADHSFVQEMVRLGEMDRERARTHPDRNMITRAVGADKTVQVDCFETEVAPGEYILLCTDGLTGMVEDEALLSIIQGSGTLTEKAERMVRLANENGGRDNITLIIIDPEMESETAC